MLILSIWNAKLRKNSRRCKFSFKFHPSFGEFQRVSATPSDIKRTTPPKPRRSLRGGCRCLDDCVIVFRNFSSEFKAEAALFKFPVFVEIELEEVRFPFGRRPDGLVQLRENVEMKHLLGKVSAVEAHVQNRFI